MDDLTKPWYTSQTIWAGIGAIGAGLGGAFWSYQHNDINGAAAGMMSAFAGLNAVVGRFRATMPIGPKATIPAAPILPNVPGALAAIGLAGFLLMSIGAPAKAASRPDVLTQISTALSQLAAKGTADIQAADALASAIDPVTKQMKDPIAHACYPAEIQFIQNLPAVPTSSAGLGPVQLFEMKRLAVILVKGGLPSYLVIGCAPLFQDEANIFVKLAAMVGVAVAVPAGGFALPALGGL